MKERNYTGKIQNLTEPGDENEDKMMKTKVEYDGEDDKRVVKQESDNVRNTKIQSQILILIPPITVYVIATTQVPAETTITESRK